MAESALKIDNVVVDNVVFENKHPSKDDSQEELLNGLQKGQKKIDPKYFYDSFGSELFEQITELPEYYPTRTERSILTNNAKEIADYCGHHCVLIEPGSGNSEKVRLLLDEIRPVTYVPMDISADFLHRAALKLGQEFPWLNVHAVCADFSDQLQTPLDQLPQGKRVVFYPGSTMGNMEPERAKQFLAGLRRWINNDGGLLIGIDLHKSESLLNAAYNDKQGVTAAFNLNALNNINKLLNANFEHDNFNHHAFYDTEQRRIEMHLVSSEDHIVRVNGTAIAFSKGESIHTENSYKYTLESFSALAAEAGFSTKRSWVDDEQLFSVHYLEASSNGAG